MKSPTKYNNLNIRSIIGQFDKSISPKKQPIGFIEKFSIDEKPQDIIQVPNEHVVLEHEPISHSTPDVQNIQHSPMSKDEHTKLATIIDAEYPEECEVDDLDYSYKAPHREPPEEYFENFAPRYPTRQDNDTNDIQDEELFEKFDENESYGDSTGSHRSIFGKTMQAEEDTIITNITHHQRPFFKSTVYIDVFTGYIGLVLLVLMIILRIFYMWQQREEVSFLRAEVKELSGVVKALEMKFSKLDVTASSISIPLNLT